jgi:hypothetical protein
MALSPSAMRRIDSLLENLARRIWNLPNSFPRAELHAPAEDNGLNIPSAWKD